MDDRRADLARRGREDCGAAGIDVERTGLVGLGRIDGGECRGVDDDVGRSAGDRGDNGVGAEDVDLGPADAGDGGAAEAAEGGSDCPADR